jgi:glycosyltransferase involved in cell wall biosynthesis
VNILFVNYGDFTTNSLNHIAGFARALDAMGHACAVAVPEGKDTVSVVPDPRFVPATYAELLSDPGCFPDGRPADLIHAWTPREGVRKFVLSYQALAHARLVIHLEDNEDHLLASWLGIPIGDVRSVPEADVAEKVVQGLVHPRRYRHFLRSADGVTVIVDPLRQSVPAGVPTHLLEPGLDFESYRPQPADPALRRELGLREEEKVVVYTGSNTFANESEIGDLYSAVALLNERGMPTRLVRTGFNSPAFQAGLTASQKAHVLDLGFVEKSRLPTLLALADVLVQPGKPGPFNDLRLPSKLPEFLSVGKPVVLPASNIGNKLRDGEDALILKTGNPPEIAEACARIFADSELADRLGRNAVSFARSHFDLPANTRALAAFYDQVMGTAPRPGSSATLKAGDTELSLALQALAAAEPDPETAALLADLGALVSGLESQDSVRGELRRIATEREEWRHRISLTEQHGTNLERQLKAAGQQSRIFNQKARKLGRQIAEVRGQLERLNEQLKLRDQAIDSDRVRIAQLEARIIALADDVAAREAKIRTMQESFSWRATQPLRFLRRRLVDSRTRKASPAVAAVGASNRPKAAGPAIPIAGNVDRPQTWSFPPRRISLGGWCFAEDGRKLVGIRAVVGERTIEGLYGLRRLDVAATNRDRPHAEHSGWLLEVEFKPSDTALRLEAGDEAGAWHAFFQTEVRVGEGLCPVDSTIYERWTKVYEGHGFVPAGSDPAEFLLEMPLISVVMPVYNTPERWLRRAIGSVRAQTYSNWQLCIADDASTEPHVRAVLEEAAASDPRVVVRFRPKNGHISEASNSALELATGSFVALLDHDDELTPDALFEVAAALDARPDAGYIYSDEDKIDEEGRRHQPYFKPDWLPDLFLGQNYTCHLSVYRTELVRAAGGFRPGYEGSQDWDLALRVVERISADQIVHIPKVLYHWRAIPGSTAVRVSEKSYSVESARRALTDHFAYLGQKVELLPVVGDNWRVKYPLPSPPPLVSLVIPTRNQLSHLRRCIDGILERTAYPLYEIIVVDNGSDDPETLVYLGSLSDGSHPLLRPPVRAEVLRFDGPFNYSAINNFAVARSRGAVVGLLNNDVEVINAEWLEEMVSQASRPEIGCVGAMLYYPNDTIQHAGVVLGLGGVAGHVFRHFPRGTDGAFNRARLAQNYSAVTAACLVVRRSIYGQVGGLDEDALSIAFNDIDFCLKVQEAGYRNLWTPFAELYHHESVSRGAENTVEKVERFRSEIETMLKRWGPKLMEDPAYNPNLSLDFPDYSLAAPPRLSGL